MDCCHFALNERTVQDKQDPDQQTSLSSLESIAHLFIPLPSTLSFLAENLVPALSLTLYIIQVLRVPNFTLHSCLSVWAGAWFQDILPQVPDGVMFACNLGIPSHIL